MNQKVETEFAPKAIGPYSQGIMADGIMFVSGQLPIEPESGAFPGNNITVQTKQSLENVKAILNKAGFGMEDVVKTTVYLQNMDDFVAMNEVYGRFFSAPYPARAAFQVAKLPKDALVEIEAIAVKK